MSIRSFLGNWIARHNQLLWSRSNGQRLERSQVAHPFAFFAKGGDSSDRTVGFRRLDHFSREAPRRFVSQHCSKSIDLRPVARHARDLIGANRPKPIFSAL